MWKDSLKNVESDNNKILYETLLDFFYNETVLTFWISLVHYNILHMFRAGKSNDPALLVPTFLRHQQKAFDAQLLRNGLMHIDFTTN